MRSFSSRKEPFLKISGILHDKRKMEYFVLGFLPLPPRKKDKCISSPSHFSLLVMLRLLPHWGHVTGHAERYLVQKTLPHEVHGQTENRTDEL